ncbi:YggT family protein [Roseisolibacter sp. H3M3-2]|uniref:YggT family protein n=1 Tax=Roseisolibacter sp. H3M3-2 TaxID=3031323 RepID=UPI0023DA2216|nr:YggT family protein [Roseisolibacter sp. H3M3-2]MDF1504508.1 YggT family protein [Roseisolibacter sp. H3M3-2]
METVYVTTGAVLAVLRAVLLAAAVAVGGAAALSWAVRTRRISPFSGVARLVRGRVDPLFAPMERRVVRAGGQPAHAPLWTLAAVVVTGIVLLSLLGYVREEVARASYALQAGPRGAYVLVVTWTFAVLRLALFARVISSWFRLSPYSPWIRWAFVLTEWMLAPLRRVIPTIGMIDITPIVAYFGLSILQGLLT